MAEAFYNRERPHGAMGNLTTIEFAMAGEAIRICK